MQLTERHIIKSTEHRFAEIDELAFKSKNLYNAANYVIRHNFIYGWGYVNYNEMNRLMNYKADSSKFTGRPKLPKYKDKTKGRNLLVYTIQAISSKQLKKGIVKLSGTELLIKTKVDPDRICQVRLVPKCDSYVIEVIYDACTEHSRSEPESTASYNDFAAGVDLGLNNLVALTSNQPGFIPLLINGRTLKSINQFYNKRSSRLQSQLKGRRKTSPRIQRLTRCRNQKVDNYLHHTSRRIVDILVAQRIGTLVIGKNAQWKTDINLGKQTNQNFVSIQEESFTSKANFLGLDPIPVYGKTKTEPVFTGKRIKRGLYKTSTGQLINSDVNGSFNILRKAIPNAFGDGIRRGRSSAEAGQSA
ncbi:MAG: transposase [Oscillatoriales cyanobacterium]|nr:MAG: transposase [Oscillatoriales cyanobacterium]